MLQTRTNSQRAEDQDELTLYVKRRSNSHPTDGQKRETVAVLTPTRAAMFLVGEWMADYTSARTSPATRSAPELIAGLERAI